MEKLFTLLVIRAITNNTDESIKIYNTIFSDQKIESPKQLPKIVGTTMLNTVVEVKKPANNKDELIEYLSYLKTKSSKTKQDRESIGVLEAVLKNMA
jgi:hypothetical protein